MLCYNLYWFVLSSQGGSLTQSGETSSSIAMMDVDSMTTQVHGQYNYMYYHYM